MALRYGGVFEQDNIKYLISSGADAVVEGNYNTWTWKWTNAPAEAMEYVADADILIDEKNGNLNIAYGSNPYGWYRFGIYKISDFSPVFESPASSDYMYSYPFLDRKGGFQEGMVYFDYGAISKSHETYFVLGRADAVTIEAWQNGAKLWSTNTRTDLGYVDRYDCLGGGISITGKYILAMMEKYSGANTVLMLYEGSYVEP